MPAPLSTVLKASRLLAKISPATGQANASVRPSYPFLWRGACLSPFQDIDRVGCWDLLAPGLNASFIGVCKTEDNLMPRVINVDKNAAYSGAVTELNVLLPIAWLTLLGVEATEMVRKCRVTWIGTDDVVGHAKFIRKLLAIAL